MTEDIMRKVRALLALAGGTTNEAEAAAAAEKAEALMLAYNLDLTRSGVKSTRSDKRFKGGLYKWQRSLWEEIARLHFCMYWCDQGKTKGAKWEHRLLGAEHNVASAGALADYLEGAINRFVRDEYGNEPRHYFSAAANAYREGMADKLAERLSSKRWAAKMEEQRRRAEQPSGGTANALVVTISDLEEEERWANQDAYYGYAPGTSKATALEGRAEYHRRVEAEKVADEALKAADPLGYEERKATEKAEREAASAAWWKKYDAQQARKKPKEKPAAYHAGYSDAERIALEEQIAEQRRKALTHDA